jgi:hypothetical protein
MIVSKVITLKAVIFRFVVFCSCYMYHFRYHFHPFWSCWKRDSQCLRYRLLSDVSAVTFYRVLSSYDYSVMSLMIALWCPTLIPLWRLCGAPAACLDDPSSHEPTMWQFDPHYPSTQQTVSCDNLPLWHFFTCTIRPDIFHPPRFRVGQFVTCNMTSTLLKMLCDIMSFLSWSRIWTVFTWFLDTWYDVLLAVKQNCGCFVTCFLHTCDVHQLWSEMCTFCSMLSGHISDVWLAVKRNVDVLSHNFFSNTYVIYRRLLATWFLDMFLLSSRL